MLRYLFTLFNLFAICWRWEKIIEAARAQQHGHAALTA